MGAIRAEVTVAPADLIGTEDTLAGLGGRYDESLDLEDETGLTSSQGWDELLSRDVLANGFPHDDLLSVGTEPAAPQPAVVRVDLGGQFRSPVAVAEAILRPGVEPDAVISLDRAPALPDSRLKAWGSAISTLTGRPIRVTLGGGSEVMVSGAPDRGPRPAREAEPQGFRTFASHGVVTPGVFGSGLKSGRHQVPFSDVRSTPILTHGEGGPRHVGVDLTRDGLTGAERSHLPTSQRGQDAGFRQVDEAYALWSEETRQQGRQEPYVVVAEPVPGKPGLVRVEVDGRSETMGPESLVRYLRDSAGLNEVPQGLPVVLAIPHAAEPYAMGKGDTPRSFAQRFAESSEHPTYSVRGEIRYEGTGGAGGTEGPRISKPDTYGGRSNTFVRSEGGRPNEVAATAADTAVRPPVRERAHVLDQDHELGAFPRSSATPRAEANAQVGELGKHLVQIGELRAKFGLTAPSVSVEGHLFGAKHESWGSTTMTERRAESVKEALSGAIQVEKLLGDTEPGTAEIEVQSRSVFGPRSAGAERGQDGPEAARPEESNVTVTVRGGGLHPTDLHEEIGGEINDTLRSLSEDHPGSYGRLMASARSIAAEHGHDGFPTQAALNMIAYARLATTPDHLLHLLAWEVTRPEPLPEEGRKLVLKGHDRNPGPLDRQPGVDYRPSEWRPMPQPTGGDAIPQGLEDSGVMRYLKDLRETGADLTRSHVEMYIDVAPGRRPGKGPGVGSSVGLRWEIPGQGSTSAFFEQSGGEGGAARNFTGKGSVYVRPSGIERPAVSYPVRITAAQLERAVQYLTGRQASVLPTDKGVTFVRQAVEYITGKEAPGGRSYFGGPSDFAAALKTSQAMFLPENAWFDGTPGEGLPPRGPAAPEPRLVSA
ncbi:hypothetical protein [Kitasatospora sp. NPDC093102]|uniref:hypothetical protein n=1 Tax=Kitasatospora sp. NPDC093102 TaxID=3155069 RepID=UPI0034132792